MSKTRPNIINSAPYAVRFRGNTRERIDALIEARGGGSIAGIVNQALASFLDGEEAKDHVADMEERIVATMNAVMRSQMGMRNELHVLMAFLDCFVRSYLTHTPPVPTEALDVQAASAAERYKKLMSQIPGALNNSDTLAAVMTDFFGE